MARTNLSIDRKVFDEFSAQAQRKNMTLFAFANESLSAISRISAEGGDPAEMYRIWRVLTILRQVDVITLPSGFVEELIFRISIDRARRGIDVSLHLRFFCRVCQIGGCGGIEDEILAR